MNDLAKTQPDAAPVREWRAWLPPLLALIIGTVVVVIVVVFKEGDGVLVGATIATAVGTILLAWQTWILARATRAAVAESANELEEVREQRVLLEKQAKGIEAQAEATARLAQASGDGSLAAARARIDAFSPMIHMTVRLVQVAVVEAGSNRSLAFNEGAQWFEAQLKDIRFKVTLNFALKNVGNAPAHVSFGDTSTRLEKVLKKGLVGIVIESGTQWDSDYIEIVQGVEAVNQIAVRMPFTYEGVIYDEMFDHIQWNGYLTLLVSDAGVAKRADRLLNQNGAQVFRSYPRLEEPDRISAQADQIMGRGKA